MHPDNTCPDGAVRIPLRARDGSIRAYAIVDAADAEWVNQWRWCLVKRYATRTDRSGPKRATLYLHRALLGLTPEHEVDVDHIDRDRLNCRRCNLRSVPKGGNQQNVPKTKGASRYRNVCWNSVLSKWQVNIHVGGKTRHVGLFSDEDEAGAAALAARQRFLPYSVD